ncbi:glycosyl transferase [Flavobacterium sp. UMI-01]|nr:glycosyl transferase [Flavobacterium sp. UMI-01]
MSLGIEYEILCQDDCSDLFDDEIHKVNNLKNCSIERNERKKGRTQNRLILANKARYNLLLFLDADVFPEKQTFIKEYLKEYRPNITLFGGYKYTEEYLTETNFFRYNYGKKREEKVASIRNLTPHSYVFSGNMLIEKSIFLSCNFSEQQNLYGLDNFFSYNLYIKRYKIQHIDNSIYHNGLEDNAIFFTKSLESVASRKYFLADKKDVEKVNSLLKNYNLIRKNKLTKIVSILFKCSEPLLKVLIFKKKTNLFAFDLYRLGYICNLK